MAAMDEQDLAELRTAAEKLEAQSFAMTVAARVGMPVEALMRFLPANAQQGIARAVNQALDRCLHAALASGDLGMGSAASKRGHVLGTAVTGALGGFFGLPGLVVELPLTTTIMLRSIAGIARSQGEDLSDPRAALACIEVLALGPRGKKDEVYESAYYATRAALAQVTRDAASYVARRGLTADGAPAIVAFLSRIATRFGVEVSEKAAAQLVPIAGAAGGLALNVVFTQHFQRVAEGHFTVRRLERKYGAETVRQAYGALTHG
jgi:hypothetical protein